MNDDDPAKAQAPDNGDDAARAEAAPPSGRGRGAGAGSARRTAAGGKAGRRGRAGAAADPVEADSSADAPDAAVASDDGAGAGGGGFRTRDLVDRVAKAAGMRRRNAKPVVELVLAELATALQEGRPMSLRPLGKITVARTRERGGSPVLTCRIRPATAKRAADTAAADPLAQSGEGG